MSKLLDWFVDHPETYQSGEKLSEVLGVSRTAIWKQIRKLETLGYEFEASTKLGYKLINSPKLIDQQSLLNKLETKQFGKQLTVKQTVDSTQNIVRQLAEEGAPQGTLVIAEQQVNGRGRMGRSWISPAGKGIWMSLLLRPDLPVQFAPQLTLMTAAALCRSLMRQTGLDIGIKWPNDLLVDGKKISGILLESTAEDTKLKYVIAGIGISVNLAEKDYSSDVLQKAVSLRIAGGKLFDREQLIADFLLEWEELYEMYLQQGFEAIIPIWESHSVSLGKLAEITTSQEVLTGTPIALEQSGAIRIKLSDGSERSIFSAEMGEPMPGKY